MHYYKRNIGDYAKKAGKLSMLEHGAYTLLMDACYDREAFPTMQEAIDWCWARTEAEIEAVKFVLRKFFTLEGDKYVQNRLREEIDAFHEKSKINSRIATEREAKRTKRAQVVNVPSPEKHEAPPNQEPRTKNQEPLNTPKPPTGADLRFEQFWKAYPKKIGKDAARKAFDKRKPGPELLALMLKAIGAQKSSAAWLKDGGQFIPNPATWLNQGRWQDEEAGEVATNDPESRAAVEAEGVRLGLGKWDEEAELWTAYKARVREAQGVEA